MRNRFVIVIFLLSFVQTTLLGADYYINVKLNGIDKVVDDVSETINGVSVLPMRYVVDGGSAEAKPLDYYYCECDEDNFIAHSTKIDVTLYDNIGNLVTSTSVTLPRGNADDKYMVRYTYHVESGELRIVYFNTNIMIRVFSKESNGNFEINGGNDKAHGAVLNIQQDANGNCIATIDLRIDANGKVTFYISDKTQKNQTGNLNTVGISSDEFYTSEGGLTRVIYDFSTGKYTSTLVDIIPGEGGGKDTVITTVLGDIILIREQTIENPTGNVYMLDAAGNKLDLGSDRAMEIIADANEATAILRLRKDVLQNNDLTQWERGLYWISFPFAVDMAQATGGNNPGYGELWNIQLYNGEKRAKDGYTNLSQTFWEQCASSGALDPNEGYVVAVDWDNLPTYANTQGVINLSFNSPTDAEVSTLIEQTTLAAYAEDLSKGREGQDSNWHLLGNPSYTNIENVTATIQDNVCFYYEWDPKTNLYKAASTEIPFKTMFSYMVQYAGTIDWSQRAFTGPAALAARTQEVKKYTLQLDMISDGKVQDKTFVQLRDEDVTMDFDMNYDLTKIINAGSNIYSLISSTGVEVAGNVVPMDEVIIPIGVVVGKNGTYTFSMPNGVEGIYAEWIDYEANSNTNMLLDEYTVTLDKGKYEKRFAIRIDPSKIVSSVENTTSPAHDCRKFMQDGRLYIRSNGSVYDVLGHTCTVR